MDDKLIEAIVNTGTIVEVSVYPPLREHLNKVIGFLMFHGIKYKIFRYGDTFSAYINSKGNSNKMWAMMQCYAQVCHAIKNGKLYKCTSVMNIGVLNKHFNVNLPESNLNIDDIPKDNAGEFLMNYLSDTIEMCRFCTKFKDFPWEATKNDASINDWIVD